MKYILGDKYPPSSTPDYQVAMDFLLDATYSRSGMHIDSFDKGFIFKAWEGLGSMDEERDFSDEEKERIFGDLVRYGYLLRVKGPSILEDPFS